MTRGGLVTPCCFFLLDDAGSTLLTPRRCRYHVRPLPATAVAAARPSCPCPNSPKYQRAAPPHPGYRMLMDRRLCPPTPPKSQPAGFFVVTLRKNGCLQTIFSTLVITFALISAGVTNSNCAWASGYFGFFCGSSAIYAAFAMLYKLELGWVLPGMRATHYI